MRYTNQQKEYWLKKKSRAWVGILRAKSGVDSTSHIEMVKYMLTLPIIYNALDTFK